MILPNCFFVYYLKVFKAISGASVLQILRKASGIGSQYQIFLKLTTKPMWVKIYSILMISLTPLIFLLNHGLQGNFRHFVFPDRHKSTLDRMLRPKLSQTYTHSVVSCQSFSNDDFLQCFLFNMQHRTSRPFLVTRSSWSPQRYLKPNLWTQC